MNAVRANHKRWRADLPAVTTPQTFDVQVSDGGPPSVNVAPGLEFNFLRPDGSAIWSLKILRSDIVVECTRYTRWAKVWPRAERYIQNVIESLPELKPEPSITLCSLVVVDRFVSADPRANISEVLKPSAHLASRIFEQGNIWHHRTGWFEDTAAGSVLNNLNIEVKIEKKNEAEGGAEQSIIDIQHIQECRMSPVTLRNAAASKGNFLAPAMELMHANNKHIIKEVLSMQMLTRLGLVEAAGDE